MNPDPTSNGGAWSRLRELALEALDREGEQRDEFIASVSGEDAAVRRALQDLARAFEEAEREDFLGQGPEAPSSLSAVLPPSEVGALVGVRMGRYRIRRLIGAGGMGAVYEAMQEQPRRIVALKVMRVGLQSRSAQRRFEYESQLLARLRHPGIAQVFEAGSHELAGLSVPYFAMEHIPGARPITDGAAGLSTAARLELMAQVCDAVHHGHQRGIVHRDLKPSNILVDSAASAKIIDFGIARATDLDAATQEHLFGTLQYMSPEQCSSDAADVDTRSDVYSLGVVLYELLTGELPYDLERLPLPEAARVIRERDPAPTPGLAADARIVLLKALEKDRDRRYQSAAELGLDLRRCARGEAISARPPSVLYQARMLARRHRALVGSAAAVLLALLAGLVVAGLGLNRALQSRDEAHRAAEEARLQAARADRIAMFLQGTLGSAAPANAAVAADPDYAPWERAPMWEAAGRPGEPATIADLLRAAGSRIDGAFPDDATIRADLAFLVGTTLLDIGYWTDARPLLSRSADLRRGLLGLENEKTIAAELALGRVEGLVGDAQSGERTLRAAFDAAVRAYGRADPRALQVGRELTATLAGIPGRAPEAVAAQRQTVDRLADILGPGAFATMIERGHLSALLHAAGQMDDAVTEARATVAGLSTLRGAPPRALADAMGALARALQERGGPGALTEAEGLQRGALERYRAAVGPDHNGTAEVAKAEVELLMLLGRFAEAEPVARQILDSARRIFGRDSLATLKAQARLARVLLAAGSDPAEALALASDAAARTPSITSQTEDYAVYHAATAADAARATGDAAAGVRECERLLTLVAPARSAPWVTAYLRTVHARCLLDLNLEDDAAAELDRAFADAERWGDRTSAIRAGVVRTALGLAERRGDAERWRARAPVP